MAPGKIITVALAGFLLTLPYLLFSQTNPFVSFEVQPGAGCFILIQWEAFAGSDTLKYEVERSRDKQNWETIAQENVRPSHRYLIMDNQPNDSLNYYRIKQVGNQAIFIYSEIKWVQVNTVTDVFIWPNPASDMLRVKTSFLNGNMDIVDAGGKLIRKIIITDFITEISTVGLRKGIYILYIRSGNRFVTDKFIKE